MAATATCIPASVRQVALISLPDEYLTAVVVDGRPTAVLDTGTGRLPVTLWVDGEFAGNFRSAAAAVDMLLLRRGETRWIQVA